jgi:CubicO group peptidase (beta-lactamase class C family)
MSLTAGAALDGEFVEVDGRNVPLHGRYEKRFRPVIDAFIENYRRDGEIWDIGSAVAMTMDGQFVVDIWGGWTDDTYTREWDHDTIICMMSVAKGITATAFNMLIDRGLVELDTPVARYWPEFAQNGKEKVLIRHLLDHTAGLPVLTPNKLWPGAMYDREMMVSTLAAQAPLWEPGTVAAYHVHTQGYLLGEVMRRVTGKLVGPFVREELAGPLDADYWLGLPASQHDRVAKLMPDMNARLLASREQEDADALRSLAFAQNPDGPWVDMLNSKEWREMEMPSGSGHGNARAVARIYSALACGGEVDGVRVMSKAAIEQMATMQHDMIELLQERHYRQGLGVLLNSPDAVFMGPNPRAFGHHGIGGSTGFVDPDARTSFSYAINRMHAVGDNGPRARRLINAAYSVLTSR